MHWPCPPRHAQASRPTRSITIPLHGIVYDMKRYIRADELFPTARPVPDAMIGRGDDVGALIGLLSQGLHQFVAGPRRQGKTTVCQAAVHHLRQDGYYVATADLFGLATLERFGEVLIEQVWANRPAGKRAGRAIAKGGKAAASAIGTAASVRLRSELGDGVELVFDPPRAGHDARRYFEHSMRLLQRICDHDERRLILFVDEFQEIGASRHPFGDPDEVMNVMRAVLQESPSVTCLFAGSMQHMMRDLLGAEHRAFFLWGAWFDLGSIAEAAWKKGLAQKAERAGVHFTLDALDRLIGASECQARTTMLIAQQAYVVAITERLDEIDAGTVEIGVELAMQADVAAHQAITEQIRGFGRRTLDVAVRIAAGRPPYEIGSPNTAKRAIDILASHGIIERRGVIGRGGWVVPDPLLRRYLDQMG